MRLKREGAFGEHESLVCGTEREKKTGDDAIDTFISRSLALRAREPATSSSFPNECRLLAMSAFLQLEQREKER